ncbi:MAG: VOC family protein [Planctomycetota bacterium]
MNLEKSERAEIFYRTVFGMTPVDHGRRGNDRFLHFQEGFLNMRPSNESSINHFCFAVEDFDAEGAREALSGHVPGEITSSQHEMH